jgi:hypothetical protein
MEKETYRELLEKAQRAFELRDEIDRLEHQLRVAETEEKRLLELWIQYRAIEKEINMKAESKTFIISNEERST